MTNRIYSNDWRNGLTREEITRVEQETGRAIVLVGEVTRVKGKNISLEGTLKLYVRLFAKLPQSYWSADWRLTSDGRAATVCCNLLDREPIKLQEPLDEFPTDALVGSILLLPWG